MTSRKQTIWMGSLSSNRGKLKLVGLIAGFMFLRSVTTNLSTDTMSNRQSLISGILSAITLGLIITVAAIYWTSKKEK